MIVGLIIPIFGWLLLLFSRDHQALTVSFEPKETPELHPRYGRHVRVDVRLAPHLGPSGNPWIQPASRQRLHALGRAAGGARNQRGH